MPDTEKDPLPEDLIVEVQAELANLVDLGVLVSVVVVNILLQKKSKKACKAREEHIVQHGQPVHKIDLTRESIPEGEMELCKHDDYVLVKVVAYHA